MSKLAKYLERVALEEASDQPELPPVTEEVVEDEPTQADVAVQEVVAEAELEIPETPEEPVTEEEVEVATEEAEEAVEEQEAEFENIEEAELIADEAAEESASLEQFTQVLKHGLKTKTYSPQFAAVVAHKMAHLDDVFGGRQPTPSLEDFSGQDLEQYYTASLESFAGFAKRLNSVFARAISAIPDSIANGKLKNGYIKQAAALNTKIDAAVQALNGIDSQAVADGVSVTKGLAVSGKDLFAGLEYDLRLTTTAATKGMDANEKLVNGAVDTLLEANAKGGVGKTGQIVAKAASLPAAADAYPSEAYETGFAGGSKLTKQALSEDGDVRSKIKALANGGVPSVVSGKAEAPDAVTLKKADIARLLKMAKVYAQLGNKVADSVGGELLNKMKTVDIARTQSIQAEVVGGSRNTTWSEGKDLDTLATALPKMVNNHIKVYRFVADHALTMAEELLRLAEKAAKKAGGSVSNEDADMTVSQEGWLGAVAGFVGGGALGALIPFAGGAAVGAAAKAQMQKLQQDIETISGRIAKIRNGQIDEATKKGLELPKGIKHIDGVDVAKGAVWGFLFGPIYSAVKGSEIENEYSKLNSKLKELENCLKQAGIEPEGK